MIPWWLQRSSSVNLQIFYTKLTHNIEDKIAFVLSQHLEVGDFTKISEYVSSAYHFCHQYKHETWSRRTQASWSHWTLPNRFHICYEFIAYPEHYLFSAWALLKRHGSEVAKSYLISCFQCGEFQPTSPVIKVLIFLGLLL